jgi:hypothetical protein
MSVQVAKVQNLAIGPGIAAPLELANNTVFLADEYSASTSAYSILKRHRGVSLPGRVPCLVGFE